MRWVLLFVSFSLLASTPPVSSRALHRKKKRSRLHAKENRLSSLPSSNSGNLFVSDRELMQLYARHVGFDQRYQVMQLSMQRTQRLQCCLLYWVLGTLGGGSLIYVLTH